jgi:hypothetical protein
LVTTVEEERRIAEQSSPESPGEFAVPRVFLGDLVGFEKGDGETGDFAVPLSALEESARHFERTEELNEKCYWHC